ncbi:MAG: hypothetical protein A2076_14440 [Geobacteraceae bacterium GWC2_53_11]|nr:MAG: hypothetical protein A2076_14440 [Geobacteraceae bacterium GWC2_53_11]
MFGKMSKLVSVCIPVYNGEKYIGETIQSVLDQNYTNIEILIQDNASTDGTWKLLQEYVRNYSNVSIQCNPRNYGMATNWNIVTSRAQGEYLLLLSADDTLDAEFLTRCLKMFAECDTDIVTTNHYYLRNGKRDPRPQLVPAGEYAYFAHLVLKNNPFSINFTLFSRNAIHQLSHNGNLFRRRLLTCDYDLWLRVSFYRLRVCYLNECLASYRMHSDNLSRQAKRMLRHTGLVILSHKKRLKESANIAYRMTILRFLYRYMRLVLKREYDPRMFRTLWCELWR